MSFTPAPMTAVPPSASTRLIAPSGVMVKADTDPAPLPVKPKRPSAVTTAQQGAPRWVDTAPLTSVTVPLASSTYDEAEPGASDTNSAWRWPKANPNGVAPAEAVVVGPLATPLASTAYRSSRLVFFSVTTRRLPSGLNCTSAGPTFEPERARVAPAIGVSAPLDPSVKPEMLPLPPAFSTYSTLPCTVRLMGSVPPDAVRLARASPAGPMSKTETSFEPALTANSRRPSSLSATAPCEPSPAPVPVPPVAMVPAAVRVPSAARLKTATALPATWLVSV